MKDLPVITAKVVERYYVCGKGFATRGALYRWLARRQIHCELRDEINRREAECTGIDASLPIHMWDSKAWSDNERRECLNEILEEWRDDGKTIDTAIGQRAKEIRAQYESSEVSE